MTTSSFLDYVNKIVYIQEELGSCDEGFWDVGMTLILQWAWCIHRVLSEGDRQEWRCYAAVSGCGGRGQESKNAGAPGSWKRQGNNSPREPPRVSCGLFIFRAVVKALFFSSSRAWMCELDYKESLVLKNWWFWIVVLEKTLRVPWTARRSNQSVLKEINSEYSLEGLMLKLKLQFGKDPAAGKGWGQERRDDRGWDGWIASNSMNMNLRKL